MGLESYLRGVVPLESPTSWPLAALQAQAVAARSYTTYKLDHVAAGAAYDICDTTACQAYGGDDARNAHSDAAVGTTAGLVRTYAGRAILAEFSSSNGGWTTSGGVPYLPAKADPYDGAMPSTVHAWRATLPAAALERAYPKLGRLASVQVLTRDGRGEWGGRVVTVRLTGDRGTLLVPGRDVYLAAAWPTNRTGLRSSWWSIHALTSAERRHARQALSTMSRTSWRICQPRSRAAASPDATIRAGSPGRRSPTCGTTSEPVTSRIVSTTWRTDRPSPLPML
jgi:SpoIID/LytB domain protein